MTGSTDHRAASTCQWKDTIKLAEAMDKDGQDENVAESNRENYGYGRIPRVRDRPIQRDVSLIIRDVDSGQEERLGHEPVEKTRRDRQGQAINVRKLQPIRACLVS